MLILYRINKKVLPFHFLKENFTNLLENQKPFLAISDPVFRSQTWGFSNSDIRSSLMIKSGVFPTSVAYSPAA